MLWAGLYWGGRINTSTANYAIREKIKISVDNGAYTNLVADELTDFNSTPSYFCFKDITSIVQSNAINARYTVADMVTRTGSTNRWGGWTIVVVYKNVLESMRNLTVFDGLANVSLFSTPNTPSVDIPISGFLTPLSGPVNFELGVVAYDGDREQTGDQLRFNGAGSFVNVSDAIHNATNLFNSTISYGGVLTPFRNPDLNNTLGRTSATSDSTRAVFAGGYNQLTAPLFNSVGSLQYITISTKGNTANFGNQFFGRYSMGAAASPTRALYFGGGLGHPSITNLNIIDFVTIATLGDAQDYGDLTEQARLVASCANSTRGLRAAGLTPTRVNTIDYVTMASTGDAINFGDLSYANNFPLACSSSTRGLFAGGYTNPASVNNIEKVEIATIANATDFGDLTRQGSHGAATSDSHGGLG